MSSTDKNSTPEDVLIYLLMKKWMVFVCVAIGVAIGFTAVSCMKKQYTSAAVIRITDETSPSNLFSSLAGNLPVQGLLDTKISNGISQVFLEVMYSREVLTALIKRDKLLEHYRKKKIELVIKQIIGDLKCDDGKAGIIHCEYTTNDPDSAQIILKDFLNLSIARYNIIQEARAREMTSYLRGEEADIKDSLTLAENRLIEFTLRTGIYDGESQAKMTFSVLSELEYRQQLAELQSTFMNASLGKNSSASQLFRQQAKLMRDAIQKKMGDTGMGNSSLSLPLKKAPIALLEERKLRTDLEGFRILHEIISKERISQESKVVNTMTPAQVLQEPYIPDWKSGPKRLMGGLLGALFAIFISTSIILLNGIKTGGLLLEEERRASLARMWAAIASRRF